MPSKTSSWTWVVCLCNSSCGRSVTLPHSPVLPSDPPAVSYCVSEKGPKLLDQVYVTSVFCWWRISPFCCVSSQNWSCHLNNPPPQCAPAPPMFCYWLHEERLAEGYQGLSSLPPTLNPQMLPYLHICRTNSRFFSTPTLNPPPIAPMLKPALHPHYRWWKASVETNAAIILLLALMNTAPYFSPSLSLSVGVGDCSIWMSAAMQGSWIHCREQWGKRERG